MIGEFETCVPKSRAHNVYFCRCVDAHPLLLCDSNPPHDDLGSLSLPCSTEDCGVSVQRYITFIQCKRPFSPWLCCLPPACDTKWLISSELVTATRVFDALSCTSFHELLTFRLGTKQETDIIVAFLAFDSVRRGISENRRVARFNRTFAVATKEIDKTALR